MRGSRTAGNLDHRWQGSRAPGRLYVRLQAPAATGAALAHARVAEDFPLRGLGHLELWVGNAEEAASHSEHPFGFRPEAYAGSEREVRDRASRRSSSG